jgi:hypothetical protein
MDVNPYESPQPIPSPWKRFQFSWLPENYARLCLLVATLSWLKLIKDGMSFWNWFGAIVLTYAAITTFRRERRQRFLPVGRFRE